MTTDKLKNLAKSMLMFRGLRPPTGIDNKIFDRGHKAGFIKGIHSSLSIIPCSRSRNFAMGNSDPFKEDYHALRKDWEVIGNDLRSIINKNKPHHDRSGRSQH
ncbi:MAG: hypothetical protein ACUZ8H_03910 [Candidatus Anammoxibacter sp.]